VKHPIYNKGDLIGQEYEVHNVLGMGGFGIVYLVYYKKKTAYAFKTFKDEYLEDKRVREQFRKEASLWINIGQHPHIVRADLIRNFVDRLFIAMEYVAPNDQGVNSLDGYLKYQPPDLAQSLRWAIQFCHGMEYAYSKGIKAHRDIKPANIMITPDKILKISDFGLAGVIGTSKATSGIKLDIRQDKVGLSCQTIEGTGFGTPTHMPPEQFTNAAECDERSDIYSFGIVLYQMATGGKLPFLATLPKDNSDEESMRFWREMYILHSKALVPKIKSPLFRIIFRCLEKDPINRYFTFKELRKDLELILKRQTGEIIKPPEIEELDVLGLKRKGLSFVSMLKWREALKCYDEVIEIDPLNERAWYNKGYAFERLEKWHEAIECYNKALELDPFTSKVWNHKGIVLLKLGKLEEALFCYDKVIENDPMDIAAYVEKGDILRRLSRDAEAADCYKKASAIIPRDEWEWKAKGDAFERLELFYEAIVCYDRALEIDSKDKFAWIGKATAFERLKKLQEALNCYDRALELDPTGAWGIWEGKGLILKELQKWEDALFCYKKVNYFFPLDISSWINTGDLLEKLGQHSEAVSCYKKAVEIDPLNARAWFDRAQACERLGMFYESIGCYDKCLESEPTGPWGVWLQKGLALMKLNNVEEAISALENYIKYSSQNDEIVLEVKKLIQDLKERD
jgi:tetratricopeptide (TPR) repeat protein